MGKVISIISQKGGVGKTTTAVNLGASLAALKQNTLILGHDPQCGVGVSFGIDIKSNGTGLYNFYLGEIPLFAARKNTQMEKLHIIPCNVKSSEEELSLLKIVSGDIFKLRSSLRQLKHRYDYILIDCPPTLGTISTASLVASDSFIVPLQLDVFSLNTLGRVIKTAKRVKSNYNSALKIEGFLLTMVDPKLKLTKKILDETRKNLRNRVFKTIIPRHPSLAEVSQVRKPVIFIDVMSTGSRAYLQLAKEIIDSNQEQ
ncbi:MAG TPA: ParA family protein [Deltaproteobacteria bacterium]|nr:ParA family protein [Deltaproteobacteria bacterium]